MYFLEIHVQTCIHTHTHTHTAIIFAKHWKRLVVQRYVKRYKAAALIVRKFIIGFMNRNKPKCEDNIYVCPKITSIR